jgi:hypothetical protein
MTGIPLYLLLAFIAIFLPTFAAFQYMVFAVNRHLAEQDRIPHSLFFGGWTAVRDLYRQLYPQGAAYQIALVGAIGCAGIAIVLVAVRAVGY